MRVLLLRTACVVGELDIFIDESLCETLVWVERKDKRYRDLRNTYVHTVLVISDIWLCSTCWSSFTPRFEVKVQPIKHRVIC
jgi:hypothetical protein